MSTAILVARIGRILRKSPREIVRRVLIEVRHELDRFTQPRFGTNFDARELLGRTGDESIDELWERLVSSPVQPLPTHVTRDSYDAVCNGDTERIVVAADAAIAHRVTFLGCGSVDLGMEIDWSRDLRTGFRWRHGFFRSIDYVNRGQPSDVKTVWELSRLQWVLPCGQAFVLTRDERYARAAKGILEQWMEANPYAYSVNWGVTMEAAMRIFTMAWLLRACGRSKAWMDSRFRERFLCCLYLHAVFTERYLERSDVNGNHFTADAAALVVAGALFGQGAEPSRWLTTALTDLESEIRLQVYPDGVDFEASAAYHRLVAELFLIASVAAESANMATSDEYRRRLAGMARFTAAYTKPDATAPLWGDHDDARTLPMGPQPLRDHRYLVGLIALHLGDAELMTFSSGPRAEAAWWFGPEAAAALPEVGREMNSQAFRDGGVYIIRGHGDHVFIDCGPLGLAGRGGHGHNDILSFEAVLNYTPVVTEGGCFAYTADFESRNRDRSARSHNAPILDGEEPNRFVSPEFLWIMHNDAASGPVKFEATEQGARFFGSHDGYSRLEEGVEVLRSISIDHLTHSISISDQFRGSGLHTVEVFLHLVPGAAISEIADSTAMLAIAGHRFELRWSPTVWEFTQEKGREAPSYGVARELIRLAWRRSGCLEPLDVCIRACDSGESV